MEALIVNHVPLVDKAATMVLRRRGLPPHVLRADLTSIGRMALVTAALRFKADSGASFKTYAMYRIAGSMLDHLRSEAPLTRGAWRRHLAGDASVRRHFMAIDEHPELENELCLPAPQEQALIDAERLHGFSMSALRSGLRSLPPRDEKVLLLYYRDGLTMREIGARIGVNESRVAQIHARGIRRLRHLMGVSV